MSITLVSVTREPVDILLRFVAWHRSIGVDRIVLYFDDPEDPGIDWVSGLDFVSVIRCTPEFWLSLRQTQETRFVKRQNSALTHGYRAVDEGWVAVADADELFDIQGRSLSDLLGAQSDEVRGLRIKTAEIVQTDAQDGLPRFRTELKPRIVDRIYGEKAVLLRRNWGLVGHREGKSFTRAGLPVKAIRQHFAVETGWIDMTDRLIGAEDGARLLHFFDRGYESWRKKLEWRLGAWGFRPDIADLLRPLLAEANTSGDETGLRAVYQDMHHADEMRLSALRSAGALYEPQIDLMQVARDMFPGAFTPD